jgi:hypothetical protein
VNEILASLSDFQWAASREDGEALSKAREALLAAIESHTEGKFQSGYQAATHAFRSHIDRLIKDTQYLR